MIYDLIVIGGGPAGISAGIYGARKSLKVLLITKDFIGQTGRAGMIENWPGTKLMTGLEMMALLRSHLESFNPDIVEGATVSRVEKEGALFRVNLDDESFRSKAVIVASGRNPRPINLEGVEKYIGKGVSYCAICDAPLFSGKSVAIIGGGNSGFQTLLEMADKGSPQIYLLEMADTFLADEILQERAKEIERASLLKKTMPVSIEGDNFVRALVYREIDSGEEKRIDVEGVFIEIGSIPVSCFLGSLVELNSGGEIVINHNDCSTKTAGLFAAGDVTDLPYKQIVIASGEGAKAALSAYNYIKNYE